MSLVYHEEINGAFHEEGKHFVSTRSWHPRLFFLAFSDVSPWSSSWPSMGKGQASPRAFLSAARATSKRARARSIPPSTTSPGK